MCVRACIVSKVSFLPSAYSRRGHMACYLLMGAFAFALILILPRRLRPLLCVCQSKFKCFWNGLLLAVFHLLLLLHLKLEYFCLHWSLLLAFSFCLFHHLCPSFLIFCLISFPSGVNGQPGDSVFSLVSFASLLFPVAVFGSHNITNMPQADVYEEGRHSH